MSIQNLTQNSILTQAQGATMSVISNPSATAQFALISAIVPAGATPADPARFPWSHDFVLNNKPQKISRTSKGNFSISNGSTVWTQYGNGILVNQSLVKISFFIDEEAQAYIARRADVHNNGLLRESVYWENKIATDSESGEIAPRALRVDVKEFIEAKMNRFLESDEINIPCDHTNLIEGTVIYSEAKDPRASIENEKKVDLVKELRRQASRVIARLDKDSDDEETPAWMAEELKEDFSDYQNETNVIEYPEF